MNPVQSATENKTKNICRLEPFARRDPPLFRDRATPFFLHRRCDHMLRSSRTPPACLTFLSDGAEFLLKFNVVTATLDAVCQAGDRGLKVHQLGTQVGVGWVETDGGHAGRQRDLRRDGHRGGSLLISWKVWSCVGYLTAMMRTILSTVWWCQWLSIWHVAQGNPDRLYQLLSVNL